MMQQTRRRRRQIEPRTNNVANTTCSPRPSSSSSTLLSFVIATAIAGSVTVTASSPSSNPLCFAAAPPLSPARVPVVEDSRRRWRRRNDDATTEFPTRSLLSSYRSGGAPLSLGFGFGDNNHDEPRTAVRKAVASVLLGCATAVTVVASASAAFAEDTASGAPTAPTQQTSRELPSMKNAMESSSWGSTANLLSSPSGSNGSSGSGTSPAVTRSRPRYWDVMASGTPDEVSRTNEKLVDGAVATINTMYYDSSGGARFDPKEFYARWREMRSFAIVGSGTSSGDGSSEDVGNRVVISNADRKRRTTVGGGTTAAAASGSSAATATTAKESIRSTEGAFSNRDDTVQSMKWLVSTINDPYSKYLTREELRSELVGREDGFLGLGALVEGPPPPVANAYVNAFDGGSSSGGASTRARRSNNGPLRFVSSSSATSERFDFATIDKVSSRGWYGGWLGPRFLVNNDSNDVDKNPTTNANVDRTAALRRSKSSRTATSSFLTPAKAANLPTVAAIAPDSPAERAGIVVGDRIAAVGSFKFTGLSREDSTKFLEKRFRAESYFGVADLTIAKPVYIGDANGDIYGSVGNDDDGGEEGEKYAFVDGWYYPRKHKSRPSFDPKEGVAGYRLSRLKSIPTSKTAGGFRPAVANAATTATAASATDASSLAAVTSTHTKQFPSIVGGDAIVHYQLLTPNDSIFQRMTASSESSSATGKRKYGNNGGPPSVGYIRLTRFSRTSTTGYVEAIKTLEEAGAKYYVIDVRNCYGGVIQEAMLTASTLIRDPHAALCYTLNSRGGFRPQENVEYVIDGKYPGYFLSTESKSASRDQVRREHPEYLTEDGWSAPTSYGSLHELRQTRGLRPAYQSIEKARASAEEAANAAGGSGKGDGTYSPTAKQWNNIEQLADAVSSSRGGTEKKVVILINEGTASAAEVFASALHDNGRAVLVGQKTYGKGLIQHTFPMPDGGGLRLTVAEYLTPALHHVTKVGGAKYDSGIVPDVRCESNQGIPKNVGADLCVGVALDVLESDGGV